MTSLKQIEANRRNAKDSTGPRSKAGKQRSSRNAVRHGLTAETVIEPLERCSHWRDCVWVVPPSIIDARTIDWTAYFEI